MNLDLLDALKAAQCERRPIVLATVIRVAGSTPRRSGASMVIDRDNTVGTIGGGAFEFRVIEDARALLGDPQNETRLVDVHLVRDLGMCCGGRMEVFLETIRPTPMLRIAGVGGTGSHLAQFASEAGFEVQVIPTDKAGIPPTLSTGAFDICSDQVLDAIAKIEAPDYLVVMTRDHTLDFECVARALATPCAFIGMIGSHHKRERLRHYLNGLGFDDKAMMRVQTPVGLDLAATTQAEIALSVVGELIRIKQRSRS